MGALSGDKSFGRGLIVNFEILKLFLTTTPVSCHGRVALLAEADCYTTGHTATV